MPAASQITMDSMSDMAYEIRFQATSRRDETGDLELATAQICFREGIFEGLCVGQFRVFRDGSRGPLYVVGLDRLTPCLVDPRGTWALAAEQIEKAILGAYDLFLSPQVVCGFCGERGRRDALNCPECGGDFRVLAEG